MEIFIKKLLTNRTKGVKGFWLLATTPTATSGFKRTIERNS
jgi:hypothetical protein